MQGRKKIPFKVSIKPKIISKVEKQRFSLLSPSPRNNPFSHFKYCEKEFCDKSNSPRLGKLPKLRAVSPTFDSNALTSQKRSSTDLFIPPNSVSLRLVPKNSMVVYHSPKTPTFIEFED
jgi:hypothetical protein